MPKGKAPFPKKKTVDSGKADKAKAVRGGYSRTAKTEGYDRTITYGGKGGATRISTLSNDSIKSQAKRKKK